jgi:hypothetical protein
MNFELTMPFWAILYCGFLIANGIMTIVINQNKSSNYILGEGLSTLFSVSFFFFYFNILQTPSPLIILIMLAHIIYQEIWVNKELYNKFILDNIPKHEREITLIILSIIMLIFLSPLIYVLVSLLS